MDPAEGWPTADVGEDQQPAEGDGEGQRDEKWEQRLLQLARAKNAAGHTEADLFGDRSRLFPCSVDGGGGEPEEGDAEGECRNGHHDRRMRATCSRSFNG